MLTINATRLMHDLNNLAEIGHTPAGGASRPTFSPQDIEARAWFHQRVLDAGLSYHQDGAGNQFATLGEGPRAILVGSHLDTVPDGGRFDGSVGALSALEALRTISEAGLDLPVRVEAVAFTDEEGTYLGLMGSRAFTGALTGEDLRHPARPWSEAGPGMERLGISHETILAAKRSADEYLAFVEVHIEQGTRLERAGTDIGVVTQIVGIRNFHLNFYGEAAHAGTMPMTDRADALWGAADFVQRARALVMEQFTPGVMNCGAIRLGPGALNIVPGHVRMGFEFRHGTSAQMDTMQETLLALAHTVASDHSLTLEIEPAGNVIPATMSEPVMASIEAAANTLGLTHTRLMSFAGHDTQMMNRFAPSAMFFIPSVNGISHNPREFSHEQDIINGANVLVNTILELINRLA